MRPRIERALAALPEVEVLVFEPGGAPADGRANRSSHVPRMTPGRAALVALMIRYLAALLDPTITILKDDAELFKQFSDNESFRRELSDLVFRLTYDEREEGA